jgi:hypothetical protein
VPLEVAGRERPVAHHRSVAAADEQDLAALDHGDGDRRRRAPELHVAATRAQAARFERAAAGCAEAELLGGHVE